MGQYYLVCNLDKRQYLHPHRFGDGMKLLEFGASGSGAMCGLAVLLADGNNRGGGDLRSTNPIIGSWAGDRIVVAGDYADADRFLDPPEIDLFLDRNDNKHRGGRHPNLYEAAGALRSLWEDISDRVIEALADDVYLRQELSEGMRRSRGPGGYGLDYMPMAPELSAKLFGEGGQ